MPSWKKLITSGSAGSLSSLSLDTALPVSEGGTGATTAAGARSNLDVDQAGTDNSTNVSLSGTPNYITISGQTITRNTIDIGDDTNLTGGTGITLTGDTLSTTDSEIVHDNLSGFVANEHIDHSSVSITAGNGLTGGGTIAASRTINIGAGTGIDVATDSISVDVSDFMSNGSNNRIVTATGTDAMNAEANLTFDGTNLSIAAGGKLQVDEVEGKSNSTNTLLLDDDQTGASNMVSLQSINHINVMTDGNNNGTGDFRVYNGSYDTDTADLRFQVDSAGVTTAYAEFRAVGDVIAFHSSDKRLKDNIIRIENPLEKIKKIGGYEFDWNDNQSTYEGHDVGVIAQEIQEVLPEVVTERDNGYLAVKYEKIVPLLIESIKELKQEVDDIKQKCDCLNK